MISGISSATNGLQSALARVEWAAGTIARGFEETAAPAPDALDMVGAEVEMLSAKLAFSASLIALRASTDMVGEALEVGGYALSSRGA